MKEKAGRNYQKCWFRSHYLLVINIFILLYNRIMIKKDYFPTQEVPSWVKARVMQHVLNWPKQLRLKYLVRYKVFIPVLAFFFVLIVWYSYFTPGKKPLLVVSTGQDIVPTVVATTTSITSTITTSTTTTTTSLSDDELLQQKLLEAEVALNQLATNLSQEEEITL